MFVFKHLPKQRKADVIAALMIAVALPGYYKIKYFLEGYLTPEQILQPAALFEVLYAFLLAVLLLAMYRIGGAFAATSEYLWLKRGLPVLLLALSAAAAVLFTRFFFTYILPSGTQSSFEFDVALLALVLPLIVSGIADRILLAGEAQDAALRAARSDNSALQARFEALKARISPHFLFNSLNTLADIVEEDQKLAVKFIEEMAAMYRYILEHRDEATVPLAAELEAVEALLFLLEVRHPGALNVSMDLPSKATDLQIVPLALQTLIENALKHNHYSKSQPMGLRLYVDGADMVLENTLHKRKNVISTGSGLENLRRRVAHICDRSVEVIETSDIFCVRVPIIGSNSL